MGKIVRKVKRQLVLAVLNRKKDRNVKLGRLQKGVPYSLKGIVGTGKSFAPRISRISTSVVGKQLCLTFSNQEFAHPHPA
jgi:hypothetical protein